jgi:hypothetical protein
MRNLIIHLLLLSWTTTSWSQWSLQNSSVIIGPGVQPEEIPYLTKGAERILQRYIENADFFDASKSVLSDQKKEVFVNLFSADARIVSDYSSQAAIGEEHLISYLDYLLFVDEKLSQTGIPFQLSDPKLEKITYDASYKRFKVELSYSKKLLVAFVPGSGGVLLKPGRTITQKMVLMADKQALTEPLIVQISALKVESVELPVVAQRPVPTVQEKQKESIPPPKEISPAIVVNPSPSVQLPLSQEEKRPSIQESTNVTNHQKPSSGHTKLGKVVLSTSNATIDNRLGLEERTNALNALQDAINQYDQYASLLDPTSGSVSDSYITNFEKLFGSQAKVYNDLMEVEDLELINYGDYISLVYNQLGDVGVRFNIVSARLEQLLPEYDDYYQATIVVDKQMLHFLRQRRDGSLEEVPVGDKSARVFPLRLHYFFKLGYPPQIENIESAMEICVREKEEQYVSLTTRYGFSFFGSQLQSGTNTFFSSEQLATVSSNIVGFSVQWSSNTFYAERSCKKPLFWTAGIGAYQLTYSTNLKDWAYAYQPYLMDNSYWKEASVRGTLNQDAQIRLVEGRFGLRYRLKSSYNTTVMADLSVLPSYVVDSRLTYNKVEGVQSITLDGIRVIGTDTTRTLALTSNDGMTTWLDAHAPSTRFDENQQVGEVQLPDREGQRMNSAVGLSASVGLSLYKRLSYSFGLIAGVDFQYGMRSPLQSAPVSSAPFLDRKAIENNHYSLLQAYQNVSFHHSVGIRLGLYYKINK